MESKNREKQPLVLKILSVAHRYMLTSFDLLIVTISGNAMGKTEENVQTLTPGLWRLENEQKMADFVLLRTVYLTPWPNLNLSPPSKNVVAALLPLVTLHFQVTFL